MPVAVFRRVFELQPNGLDNTAVSTTCKAWQAALESSTADSVCLYAATDSQEQRWQRFLSSKSSINRLELVRAASWTFTADAQQYTLHRSDQIAQATIDSIPTACRSLTLSEFCSHYLDQYVNKSPQLEQLSFEGSALRCQGSLRPQAIPDLTPLSRLTQLTISMQSEVFADLFPQLIESCPACLESLNLHGFHKIRSEQSVELLPHCLPGLTHLHITDSTLELPDECITCLSKLKSLSLKGSSVHVDDRPDFERLTALTFLDLGNMYCPQGMFNLVRPFASFTAWTALVVLKIQGCKLFCNNTRIDFAMVKEASVSSVLSGDIHDCAFVPAGTVMHLHALQDKSLSLAAMSHTKDVYTELVTGMEIFLHEGAEQSIATLVQLGAEVPRLCNLDVCFRLPRLNALPMQMPEGTFPTQLTSLRVLNLVCNSLALQSLTSLVSLNLALFDKERKVSGCISFTTSLQALTFKGSRLFEQTAQHNLRDLTCLSSVTLIFTVWMSIGQFNERKPPTLPHLPACVTHLTVHEEEAQIGTIDWTALSQCHRLQHLTLGSVRSLTRGLQAVVSALPLLLAVNYRYAFVFDQCEVLEGDSLSSTYQGTKMLPAADYELDPE